MIEGHDIVCLSTTDWDEIWGSRQQIMRRLAAKNRILFVERQVGPEHVLGYRGRLESKRATWERGLVEAEKNLWIWSPPLVWPFRNYSRFCSIHGQRRVGAALGKVIESIDFRSPILWIYQLHSGRLIGNLNEALSVYHCIDQFKGGAAGRKRAIIEAEEAHTIRSADLVLVHSKELLAEKKLVRPDCHYVPSAADVDHYEKALSKECPTPDGFPATAMKVAVVMGTLDRRLDMSLLSTLCKESSGWEYVFVGELKVELPPELSQAVNAHFVGKQPFLDLPNWLAHADVGLIPYRVDESTRFINPLKVHEYLAAGLPVVSTALPEVHAETGDVEIREDASGFLEAMDTLAYADSSEARYRRHAASRENSWDARVEQVSGLIENALRGASKS